MPSAPTDPQTLRAATDEILELHEDGQLDAALRACDDLLAAATDLDDPVVRESAFAAGFERAALLAELGELDAGADAALTTAAALPFDRDDPDQTHELAMLLVHAGTCRGAVGDAAGALTIYDRLVAELGDARDPVTRGQVVRGRVNRASALLVLDRADAALEAARGLVLELDGDDPVEAEQLGLAQRIRAAALRTLGRPDEAIRVLREAEGLAAVPDVGAREQAAAARAERAELLAELGRADEAASG